MTKIRKSRRGFTLLEIVIVVAIIVIVAGAAFLGVTVTLTRANAARNELIQHNGDNFEVDARNEIEHLKADPNFTPIQEYTPDGETDDDEDDDDDDDDEDDDEDDVEEENGGGPVNNQPGHKNSPTPTPTNTPTPTPTNTNTPTPTPVPTEVPDTDNPTPSYGNTGRPSSGTTTYAANDTSAASGTSINISQKGDQYNACRIEASIPHGTNTAVLYVGGAGSDYEFKSYNGTVTNLGDGYYRVKFYNDNTQSIQIYSDEFKGATEAYVVEYTTTK